jgi:hypothetical protein
MRLVIPSCIALVAGMSLATLSAQPTRNDRIGARVRLTLAGVDSAGASRVVVGSLVAVGDTAVSVQRPGAATAESFPVSRVQRFEVRMGRDRRAGARLGAIVGLTVGLVFGYASGEDCTAQDFVCFDRDETTVAGAILGAGLGGWIGLLVGRGDRWRVEAVPQRVSVMPAGGPGVRVGVSYQF